MSEFTPKQELATAIWQVCPSDIAYAIADAIEGLILDVISKTNVPDKQEIPDARCSYCGLTIAKANEDILVFMREHIRRCSSNPMVQEIAKLKEQLSNFVAAGNRSNLQLAVCHSCANGELKDLMPNDPGYSKSYRAVLDLRREYDLLIQEKAERDIKNVSKPIITHIPDGWESSRFTKPDNSRNIEIKLRSGEISEGFYDGCNWFFKRKSDKMFDVYTSPFVLCWRELATVADTTLTPELKVGDTVWVKGELMAISTLDRCNPYMVRLPGSIFIELSEKEVKADK